MEWGLHTLAKVLNLQILGTSGSLIYIKEHSVVDPVVKKMEFCAAYITFTNLMSVNARLVDAPRPENPGMTVLMQEAIATVKGISRGRHMGSLKTNTMSSDPKNGQGALEAVISRLPAEWVGL
ncbi:PRELI domain containing protein 3A-like [Ailuropoda melanoleuca]|uniref:PRELI domain containing protein 3A-like n=1 Tax=Ailuropoda melanoleuca TaxID=9646 RepID=UPI0001DEC133|nr:PRELI domain containing protein 3A-like [Ailuropoda melanoleuca]